MSIFSPAISKTECKFLHSLPKQICWGVYTPDRSQPHLHYLISQCFSRIQDAIDLKSQLRTRADSDIGVRIDDMATFKIKKGEDPGYAVMFRLYFSDSIALQGDLSNVSPSPLISKTVEVTSLHPLSSHFDIEKHPLDILNNWKAADPEYVQTAMSRQMERACKMHGPKENDQTQWFYRVKLSCDLVVDEGHVNGLSYGYATTQGLRRMNEDRRYIASTLLQLENETANIPLFGILDGHLGYKGRDEITAGFINNFADTFNRSFAAEYACLNRDQKMINEWIDLAIFNALKLSFVDLSERIRSVDNRNFCVGTTATVSILFKGYLYTACSGDSRAMYITRDSSTPLSWDAKVFAPISDPYLYEKFNRSLYNRGSCVTDWHTNGFPDYRARDGLNMTRSLGHLRYEGINARPKITKIHLDDTLNEEAFILCASDGLWDVAPCALAASTVLEASAEGKSCKEIAKILVENAFHSRSGDNISVLILKTNGCN